MMSNAIMRPVTHPCFSRHLKRDDLAVVGYTDAAQRDVDGSSTTGYVMTIAPYGPFIEGHMTDTTLIGWSTNKHVLLARSSLSAANAAQHRANAMDTR